MAMTSSLKTQIMESYLQHQLSADTHGMADDPARTDSAFAMPDNAALAEFKAHVNAWIENDKQQRALKESLRAHAAAHKDLTAKILDFMTRHNIEDLNTQAGKIRYKLSVVKEPLSQQTIKDKVAQYYGETRDPAELTARIFERKTLTKPTLRRLTAPKPKGGAATDAA